MKPLEKSDVLRSIGRDRKSREELVEAVSKYVPPAADGDELESLSEAAPEPVEDRVNRILEGEETGDMALEAIVRRVGRPVIRVRDDDLLAEDIETDSLAQELAPHRSRIREVIRSVGRIELTGHRQLPWVGTGWVVDEDIIVTNRHVAAEFGAFIGSGFRFLPGVFGGPIDARIDMRREDGNNASVPFDLEEILHIEPAGGPDIALLRVAWNDGPRAPIPLWTDAIDLQRRIAVLGYPAKDSRTNMPAEMDRIFGGLYNVKRFAPGFVMASSEADGQLIHDCTTLGGNSGSVVVDVETGRAVALHFAGREETANFAVMGPVIRSRVDQAKSGSTVGFGSVFDDFKNEVVEETPTIDTLSDREGYDPDFLARHVPLPTLSSAMEGSLAPVDGRDDGELKYTHYSVFMNRDRKIAFYSVVNIDGRQLHRIPRGSDKWYFDPRIDRDHQVGNELYKSNPLDRGHLVRRLDPSWGGHRNIAELAIEDSFFYTNCAPQHLTLNRRMWLGLEDHILDNAGAEELKVTVFSGPIFDDEGDEEYRGIQIPNEFWKVVVIVKPPGEDGAGDLSATGYVLSQRSLIDDLEFVFGEHQGFQVRIDTIEDLTGLSFGDLHEFDPLARLPEEEAIARGDTKKGRRIRSLRDILV